MSFVQQYRNSDQGAPVLTGQVGSLVALLDAVLVNGLTTAAVTSIVESGTTYTVTLTVANPTLVSGNYVTISGGSPGGINAVWGPITYTDSTHFTFVGPGSLGSITGTILYRKAPLGWTKPFTGTNGAVFRPAAGPQHYLQIVDNAATAGGAKEAQAMGFETMSAYNTGTGQFPTTAQLASSLLWLKSTTADGTARTWCLFGDDKTILLFLYGAYPNDANHGMGFGYFPSLKSGDAYNTFLNGSVTQGGGASGAVGLFSPSPMASLTSIVCTYCPRSYSQTGTSISLCLVNGTNTTSTIGGLQNNGTAVYAVSLPNPCDSGYYFSPLLLLEGANASVRGRLPGLFFPLHGNVAFNQYDEIRNAVGLPGGTVLTVATGSNYQRGGCVGIDTYGPWT